MDAKARNKRIVFMVGGLVAAIQSRRSHKLRAKKETALDWMGADQLTPRLYSHPLFQLRTDAAKLREDVVHKFLRQKLARV